jgi:hypothetical protein
MRLHSYRYISTSERVCGYFKRLCPVRTKLAHMQSWRVTAALRTEQGFWESVRFYPKERLPWQSVCVKPGSWYRNVQLANGAFKHSHVDRDEAWIYGNSWKKYIIYLEVGRRSKRETPNAVDKATLGSEPREERHQVFYITRNGTSV